MTGKILALVIVISALVMGGGIYYFQVYGYYDRVAAPSITLVPQRDTAPEPLEAARDVAAIDATSSPIRYRACFVTDTPLDELAARYTPYEGPTPLEGPGWFDCYEAGVIGDALEAGTARAFLSQRDVHYGIDRVVGVTADGRGFVWHQINHCGEVVFDGQPTPADCPPPPAAN